MYFLPLVSSLTFSRWICFARHLSPSPELRKGGSSIHFPLVTKPSWLHLFSVCYGTLNVNPQCSQIFPELHSCSPSFCSAALHVIQRVFAQISPFPGNLQFLPTCVNEEEEEIINKTWKLCLILPFLSSPWTLSHQNTVPFLLSHIIP